MGGKFFSVRRLKKKQKKIYYKESEWKGEINSKEEKDLVKKDDII